MAPAASTFRPVKAHKAARRAAKAWRDLTANAPNPRTLLACSSGADSSAMAIALAASHSIRRHTVLAHIVHDLRPRDLALADRDAAKSLADALDLPFAEAEVTIDPAANAESTARRLRYDALATLAAEHDCRYVATAHHADDQLETILMRLIRGAGPRGLAAIRTSRPLDDHTTLIRPMLALSHDDCQRLCRAAGWSWREDHTNADTSRLRAALRTHVLPELRAIAPGAPTKAAEAAKLCESAADLIAQLAERHQPTRQPDGSLHWPRAQIASLDAIVLAELLRQSTSALTHGANLDRLTQRELIRAADRIADQSTDPRQIHLASTILDITARDVTLRPARPYPLAP